MYAITILGPQMWDFLWSTNDVVEVEEREVGEVRKIKGGLVEEGEI